MNRIYFNQKFEGTEKKTMSQNLSIIRTESKSWFDTQMKQTLTNLKIKLLKTRLLCNE